MIKQRPPRKTQADFVRRVSYVFRGFLASTQTLPENMIKDGYRPAPMSTYLTRRGLVETAGNVSQDPPWDKIADRADAAGTWPRLLREIEDDLRDTWDIRLTGEASYTKEKR